jgi:hypothetical protein
MTHPRATEVVFDLGVFSPVVIEECSLRRVRRQKAVSMVARSSSARSTEVRRRTSVAQSRGPERLDRLRCRPAGWWHHLVPILSSGHPARIAAKYEYHKHHEKNTHSRPSDSA